MDKMVIRQTLDSGLLVVIDVVEAADEDEVFADLKRRILESKRTFYDATFFQRSKNAFPPIDHIPADRDFLFLAEPSYALIGRRIREERAHPSERFQLDGNMEAVGDSTDRQMQHAMITLPFLRREKGRVVIQNRGLISSVARLSTRYQNLTPDKLYRLDGNREVMKRPPEIIFLVKRSDAGCRRTPYDYAVAQAIRSESVIQPILRAGTKIRQIDATDAPKAIAKRILLDIAELQSGCKTTTS